MTINNKIHIAAALITRPDGQTLLVRKRNTHAFIQPGGKIQAGERAVDALCRELEEELHFMAYPDQMIYLGCFSAPAVNESGYIVVADVFHLVLESSVMADAEIEEVLWVDPANLGDLALAPLTRDYILPLLNTI